MFYFFTYVCSIERARCVRGGNCCVLPTPEGVQVLIISIKPFYLYPSRREHQYSCFKIFLPSFQIFYIALLYCTSHEPLGLDSSSVTTCFSLRAKVTQHSPTATWRMESLVSSQAAFSGYEGLYTGLYKS